MDGASAQYPADLADIPEEVLQEWLSRDFGQVSDPIGTFNDMPISSFLGPSDANQKPDYLSFYYPSNPPTCAPTSPLEPSPGPEFSYSPPNQFYTLADDPQFLGTQIFNGFPDTDGVHSSGRNLNFQGTTCSVDYDDHSRPLPHWSGATGFPDTPLSGLGSDDWTSGASAASTYPPVATERMVPVSIPPGSLFSPPRAPQRSVNCSPRGNNARSSPGNVSPAVPTAAITQTPLDTPADTYAHLISEPSRVPRESTRKHQREKLDSLSPVPPSQTRAASTTKTRKRPYTADTTANPDDDEKTRKTKQNTEAARRFRDKKALHVKELEDKNAAQAETIRLLQLEVVHLKGEAAGREAVEHRGSNIV